MRIEDKIFARCTFEPQKALSFGFEENGGVYEYSESFMDGAFLARIRIRDGKVQGTVYDTELNEEYNAVFVEAFSGGFVGEVRERYAEILRKIKASCFLETSFLSAQANRIAELVAKRFGECPDHPFDSMDNYGVFRYPATKKWYGLIMNVPKNKVTHDSKDEGGVDVLNLKIDQAARDEILSIKGIYPAYHMNHRSWASILLDESVDDEKVMDLLFVSREFAKKSKK